MNDPIMCCRDLSHLRGRIPSPFTRVLALDWSDGPRAGIVECRGCGREFRFELLGERFDEGDGPDLRVYSLASLPGGSVARIIDALADTHRPRWPVWAPVWTFPDPAVQGTAEAVIDHVLEQAGPPELAVATTDLATEIQEARAITAEDIVAVHDWVAFVADAPASFEI